MSVNKKQFYLGEVISDKMDKTRVVKVERTFMHPFFKKIVRMYKKYKVHDNGNVSKTGDKIEFYEGRPLSKTKYMYLHRIVESSADQKVVR